MKNLRRGDDGMTVVELMVTIFVLGVLSTVVVTLFVNVSTTFTRDRAATDSVNVAALGMNEVTKVVRAGTEIRVAGAQANAPVFIAANNEEVVLYSYLADGAAADLAPVKVRLQVDPTSRELTETRWSSTKNAAGYWIFSATAGPTRTIARLIPTITPPLAAGQKYLFTYYTAGNTQLVVPAGGLTESQRGAIAAVQVTVTVQTDLSGRAKPVTLQNTVGLPNLGVSRVGP